MAIKKEQRGKTAKRAMAMLLAGFMTMGSIGDGCAFVFAEEQAAAAALLPGRLPRTAGTSPYTGKRRSFPGRGI